MLWLQLGARVHAPAIRAPDRVTGEYALHVQCPWRVSAAEGIIVGSGDGFAAADGSPLESESIGPPLVEVLLQRWIADQPLIVTGVDVDPCGGFRLSFVNGSFFEAFPDGAPTSCPREHWRLLSPALSTPHFVLLDTGPEYQ